MSYAVDAMVDDIIEEEGGYVDHPNDRGGATKYGITIATLSRYKGRKVTKSYVRAITKDLAKEIYIRNYLSAPRIDTLPDSIVHFVFDCSINHGPRRAVKFVQQVCDRAGFGPVSLDGVVGPQTRHAAEMAEKEMGGWFLAALVEERKMFFRAIVDRDPSQKVFLDGWIARASKFDPGVDI